MTSRPTATSPLLTVRDLSVAAGGQTLLAQINFELRAAELVALTGPSGLGKTTLLRALCGLDEPTSGMVELENQTPAQWGHPAFRRRVLLVDQRPILFDATLEANLRRPFEFRSAQTQFSRERAVELLERVGLNAERLTQNARSLSVGQQQRASLVRALLLEPSVFLFDEPTSALDGEAVAEVEALIREDLSARGAAGLVVTHSAQQAREWCDRQLDVAQWKIGAD